MKTLILAALALVSADVAASSQGFGGGGRNFTVRQFETIRIDGPVRVELEDDVAPYARVEGDNHAIHNVNVRMNGKTLIVSWSQSGRRGYRGESHGPVTVKVGTRDLGKAFVNGSGDLVIDRVERRTFDLSVNGAGAARIGEIDVDQLEVALTGAANARIEGEAKEATLIVRGMSNLDAERLEVRDMVLGVEGPSFARVHANNAVEIDAIGTVDIQVSGNPACTIRAQGPARITGCR